MFDIKDILKDKAISYRVINDKEILMTCPSCDKEDHFYYNVKKNLGICHRCKWACNAVAFLMAVFDINVDVALELCKRGRDTSPDGLRGKVRGLLEEVRLGSQSLDFQEVYFKNPLPMGLKKITRERFPKVFKERKVSYELAVQTGALICNQGGKYFNRIVFPIKTLRTETFTAVTALSKKAFREAKELAEEKGGKYRKSLFPKKSFMSEVLYGYNDVIYKKNIFVVEGIWDVLKMRALNLSAVGLLGSSVSNRQVHLLSRTEAERIFLMLDGSVPIKNLKKIHNLLSKVCIDKEVRVCILPNGKDPDESSVKKIKDSIKKSKIYLF